MTLLKKLQSALAKVDGNTLLIEEDRGYDEYYCTICKERVLEESYNFKKKCCYQCFYNESDHTRYDDGDEPEEQGELNGT